MVELAAPRAGAVDVQALEHRLPGLVEVGTDPQQLAQEPPGLGHAQAKHVGDLTAEGILI